MAAAADAESDGARLRIASIYCPAPYSSRRGGARSTRQTPAALSARLARLRLKRWRPPGAPHHSPRPRRVHPRQQGTLNA